MHKSTNNTCRCMKVTENHYAIRLDFSNMLPDRQGNNANKFEIKNCQFLTIVYVIYHRLEDAPLN